MRLENKPVLLGLFAGDFEAGLGYDGLLNFDDYYSMRLPPWQKTI